MDPVQGTLKNKKIIYLVTEDWYFVSHRLPLACAAKKAGFDVLVITQVNEHSDQILAAGLQLKSVEFSRSHGRPWQDLKTLVSIYRIYKEQQPDLVHHVSLKPVIYGSVAAWFTRVSGVVNALTGLGFVFSSTQKKARLIRLFVQPLLKFFLSRENSWLIVQNLDDQAVLQDSGIIRKSHSILIKGSGVDVKRFKAGAVKDSIPPMVLLASRMLWDKGVGEFVEAAKMIHRQEPSIRLVLVGDRDSENPSCISAQQLSQWHESGIVEWWGRRDDMPQVLLAATLVCLPSYREGLPKVLIEAAACGKAIVTTDAPGCREIVRHEVNGLTVPVKDPEALAAAIMQLLNDKKRRDGMGRKSRELVEQEFTIEQVCRETLDLYRRALSQR